MTDIERQFREDRMLRGAARRLLQSGLANLRGEGAAPAVPARALSEVRQGSAELLDSAIGFARQHRAGLGAAVGFGLAALLGWIFRDHLADAVHDLSSKLGLATDGEAEPESPVDHP